MPESCRYEGNRAVTSVSFPDTLNYNINSLFGNDPCLFVYAYSLDSLKIYLYGRIFSDSAQNPRFFGDYRVKTFDDSQNASLINK